MRGKTSGQHLALHTTRQTLIENIFWNKSETLPDSAFTRQEEICYKPIAALPQQNYHGAKRAELIELSFARLRPSRLRLSRLRLVTPKTLCKNACEAVWTREPARSVQTCGPSASAGKLVSGRAPHIPDRSEVKAGCRSRKQP